jgi:Tfp pilus assembly protein PilF
MARNKLRSRRHTHRYRSVILVLVAITTVLAGIGVYRYNTATSPQDHLAKANLYFAQQQPKAAMIELKNALQADPDYLDARWLLVQVYLDVGDGVSASKEINAVKGLGKNDAALERAVLKSLLLQHKYTEALGHLITQSDQSVDAELLLIQA